MTPQIDKPKWYVAQIKANGFERAVANLARQGFLTFSPMQKKTVRHARQLKNVLRPVFPGYLFVQFSAKRGDWRKINSTLGVARLVSFEKSLPASVPDSLIAGLRARCDAQDCLQVSDDLRIGEKVKIVAGAFAGFVGEVENFISEERIRLLYDFMGQKSRIEIKKAYLENLFPGIGNRKTLRDIGSDA